jgi:hypothetical protein
MICGFASATAAFTPAGLGPDDANVFTCCSTSASPDFGDFMAATEAALYEEVHRIFEGGEVVLLRPSSRDDDGGGNRNYTEVSLGGGPDRFEAYAFEGYQTGPAAVVGGYEENRSSSKDDAYDIVRRGGGGSVMLSDPAGTMIGVTADYAGKDERAAEPTPKSPTTGFDSGQIIATYRSHFWGTSKLSTKISDIYSRQTGYGPPVTDNLIEADTDFTFLWLGDNSLRGSVTLQQENINVSGGGSTGALYSRILLENDFRVGEKMRFGVGVGGFILRRDTTFTRLYPRSSIHIGLTRYVGVFAKYRPSVRVPAFRELYVENNYSLAEDYIPFTDAYAALEIGLVNNVTDALHTGAVFYEKRFRNDYARTDAGVDSRTTYRDVGKYYARGISVRAKINLHRLVSMHGAYGYERVTLKNPSGGHIPYRPQDILTAGFTFGERTGHNLTATLERRGKRYADAPGTVVLPPALIAGAALRIRLSHSLTIYVKGENLGDATYDVIYRIPAPGRSLSAGLKMVL